MLAWASLLSNSFSATQERFSRRIRDGKTCHTLLPPLSKFEKVSNSQTQGKELKSNPDLLDLLKDKVSETRYVPLSLKEAASLERAMRSALESYNFMTWAVLALFKMMRDAIPEGSVPPKLPHLQKSLSKVSDNIASNLSAQAAFVTLKRRQLLLSHAVPSVSDPQKRTLLADPFFGTGSLFSSASVEATRAAARDASLFRPHIKSATSSPFAKRSGHSGSAPSRPRSGPGARQPFHPKASPSSQQQQFKKGNPKFHKKSSDPQQKRGGFRR